jgi:hypothetical protein
MPATCITVLDDASVGGNDATYLWTCSASPGSILLPFPFPLRLLPRRVLKHSHESPSSLSYFLISLLGSIRLAAGSVIMFGFITTLCS